MFFSIFSTVRTYREWKDNPTITTIQTTAYPIKNIEFPAITICSQGTSKDVMDTVILKQFEEYLRSKGINAQRDLNSNGNHTLRRRKRGTETRISDTLSKKQVHKF